jgi:hypothetical protein
MPELMVLALCRLILDTEISDYSLASVSGFRYFQANPTGKVIGFRFYVFRFPD